MPVPSLELHPDAPEDALAGYAWYLERRLGVADAFLRSVGRARRLIEAASALVDLRDFHVLRGSLPKRAMALVLEWAGQHRGESMEDWTLCSQLRPPRPIEPLR